MPSMGTKIGKSSNLRPAESMLNRLRVLRGGLAPALPRANVEQKDDDEPSELKSNRTSKSSLKRWLSGVGSRRRKSIVKVFEEDQHQINDSALRSPPATQPRSSEPKGESEKHLHHVSTLHASEAHKISNDEDGHLNEPLDVLPLTSSELFDFPPPPPGIGCSNETSGNYGNRRGKGKETQVERIARLKSIKLALEKREQTQAKFPSHRRTRGMLNERTFTVKPRYSSPQTPFSPSRPLSELRRSSSRPSLNQKLALPVSEPTSSQSPKRQQWSHLSNPLPLPPGWTFQPDSAIPVREPNLRLSKKSSHQDSLRASRSHSRNGSIDSKHSQRHYHRRPPSPRPTDSIRSQPTKPPTSPRRSWSASSPVFRHRDRRIASFSSLGNILGGNSSGSDSCSNASSWSVAISVVGIYD